MRFITGIIGVLSIGAIILLVCAGLAKGTEPMHPGEFAVAQNSISQFATAPAPCPPTETGVGCIIAPSPSTPIFTIDGNGVMHPKPLSAIMVSQCGGALALFIQVDANHLLRADPRQSDVFVNVDGKMEQSTVGPLEWGLAYNVAAQAVITTHVVVPCDSKEATT